MGWVDLLLNWRVGLGKRKWARGRLCLTVCRTIFAAFDWKQADEYHGRRAVDRERLLKIYHLGDKPCRPCPVTQLADDRYSWSVGWRLHIYLIAWLVSAGIVNSLRKTKSEFTHLGTLWSCDARYNTDGQTDGQTDWQTEPMWDADWE